MTLRPLAVLLCLTPLVVSCGGDQERAQELGRQRFEEARAEYERRFQRLGLIADAPSPPPPTPVGVDLAVPADGASDPPATDTESQPEAVDRPQLETPSPAAGLPPREASAETPAPPPQRPSATAPAEDALPTPSIPSREGRAGAGSSTAPPTPGLPGSDAEPPRVGAVRFEPADAPDGVDVRVFVQALDDLSGPAGGSGSLTSPSGKVFIPFALSPEAGGTMLVGQFKVPPGSEPGSWHITNLRLTDLAQNSAVYTPRDDAVVRQARLNVTSGRVDTEPPVLDSVAVSPSQVEDGGSVQVSVTARDNVGEVTTVRGILANPSRTVQLNFYPKLNKTSGAFEGRVALPRHSELGDWTVTLLTLTDGANNRATISGDDPRLENAKVSVMSFSSDTTPPQLLSIALAPSRVENGGSIEISVVATDDVSGVRSVDGWVVSPNAKARIHFTLRAGPGAGEFRGNPPIPASAAAGWWKVERLAISDTSGNRAILSATDPVLGAATFEVY